MKVNFKKVITLLIILIVWCGCFIYIGYIVGQFNYNNVTTDYNELKTQRVIEDGINFIALAGGIFLNVKIGKEFIISKKKKIHI